MEYFQSLMAPRPLPPMNILPDPTDGATEASDPAPAADPTPAPAPTPAPVPDVNPFAQWSPHAAPQAAQPAPAQPAPVQQPTAAPTPAPAPDINDVANAHIDMTDDQTKRQGALNATVGQLIGRDASDQEFDAALAPYGVTRDQIKNLEDGRQYHRDHPHSAVQIATNADEALRAQALRAGLDKDFIVNKDGTIIDKTRIDPGAARSALIGAGQGLTFGGADEGNALIGAGVQSLGNAVGIGNGRSFGDNFHDQEAYNQALIAQASANHAPSYYAGEIAGGLVPALATDGSSAALQAGGLRAAGRLAVDGGVTGAANGFLANDGDLSDRLHGAAYGALGGAATGATLGSVANSVANRVTANMAAGGNAGRRVLDAADRLNDNTGSNIEPLVGITSHGGLGSQVSAALDGTIIGGRLSGLHAGTNNVIDQAGRAADTVANREAGGAAHDITSVAEGQTGGQSGTLGNYLGDTKTAAQNIYGQAEQAAGKAQIPAPATVRKIDDILAGMQRNPDREGVNGAVAARLQTVRAQLLRGENPASGAATWTAQGLRDMRTSLSGDNITAEGRALSNAANQLWAPMSQDIQTGLRVSGNGAAGRLYQQADRQWAIREGNRQAIEKVVGTPDQNWSADRVANNLVNMSQSDGRDFQRAMRAIDPAQAQQIRGGLINQMGLAKTGRATERGQFSLDTFTTNWTKMSDQAKRTTGFTGDTIRDLDDLATIGHAARSAGQLANSSRTAPVSNTLRTIAGVGEKGAGIVEAAAYGTGHALAILPAVAGATSLLATGFALGRPGVARALVNMANSGNTVRAANALRRIASRDPSIAGSVGQAVNYLAGSDAPTAQTAPTVSTEDAIQPAASTDDNPFAAYK